MTVYYWAFGRYIFFFFFFFNDTATTEIYTLSLHDALPIFDLETMYCKHVENNFDLNLIRKSGLKLAYDAMYGAGRSEEHTSELQSQSNLVCRLLLEKKKEKDIQIIDRRMRDTHRPLLTAHY